MGRPEGLPSSRAQAGCVATEVQRRTIRRLVLNVPGRVGVGSLLIILLLAVVGPLLTPYSPVQQNLTNLLSPPSRQHLLGTDDLGRDLLTRIAVGARSSLLVGVGAALVGMCAGVPLGLVSGYYRGTLDGVITRALDGLMAFPALVLAMAMGKGGRV